ncbi:MAG: hypothetical protein AAF968_18695 [Pseudomonadota bacterium]
MAHDGAQNAAEAGDATRPQGLGTADGPVCILHIGAEKTGTTSIQESLHANRAQLASAGIAWPEFLGHRNHKLLAAAALPPDSEDAAMAGNAFAGSRTAHAAHRNDVAARIAALAESHGQVLISSEDLQRLPRHAVEALGTILRPCFTRFRIVVFLLRQDLLALRRRAQLIRTGHMAPAGFPTLESPAEHRFYDYAALLADWAAVFGDEAILPVPIGEGSSSEGADSVDLFYRALQIDAEAFAPVPRLNASPDSPSLEILNRANGMRLLPGDARRSQLERRLARFEPDRRAPVSREEATAFLNRFADSNATLSTRWLDGAKAFTSNLESYPQADPRPAIAREAERRLLLLSAQADEPDAGEARRNTAE